MKWKSWIFGAKTSKLKHLSREFFYQILSQISSVEVGKPTNYFCYTSLPTTTFYSKMKIVTSTIMKALLRIFKGWPTYPFKYLNLITLFFVCIRIQQDSAAYRRFLWIKERERSFYGFWALIHFIACSHHQL